MIGAVAIKTLNVSEPSPQQLQGFKNEVAVLRWVTGSVYSSLLRRRPFGLSRTREDALREEPKPWAWFLKGNLRSRALFCFFFYFFRGEALNSGTGKGRRTSWSRVSINPGLESLIYNCSYLPLHCLRIILSSRFLNLRAWSSLPSRLPNVFSKFQLHILRKIWLFSGFS